MGNKGPYQFGGFTNFAEIYIDVNHNYSKNYKRTLNLNEAISTVNYQYENVEYTREYFANYPSQIIAVKLKADKPGMISFTIRPTIPYLKPFDKEQNGRSGHVQVLPGLITMTGNIQYYDLDYEAQIKIVNYNGTLTCKNENKQNGIIEVTDADSVVLYITAATSYQLQENVFLRPNTAKFKGNVHPHSLITNRIKEAVGKDTNSYVKNI